MSQTVMIELPDPVYQAVKETAEANGSSPAEWITTTIVEHLPQPAAGEQAVAGSETDPVIQMMKQWAMEDAAADDDWPILKSAIEQNRLSYRSRFHE